MTARTAQPKGLRSWVWEPTPCATCGRAMLHHALTRTCLSCRLRHEEAAA